MDSKINCADRSTNIYDIKIMLDFNEEPSVTNFFDGEGQAMMNHDILETSRNQDEPFFFSGTEDHFSEQRWKLIPYAELTTTQAQVPEHRDTIEHTEGIKAYPSKVTETTWNLDGSKYAVGESGTFSVENSGVNEAPFPANRAYTKSFPDIRTSENFGISLTSPNSVPAALSNTVKSDVTGIWDVFLPQGDCERQHPKDCDNGCSLSNLLHQKTTDSSTVYHSGLSDVAGDAVYYPTAVESNFPQNNPTRATVGFKCSQCHKVFSTKYILADHEKIHQDKNIFRCRQCSKRYSSSLSLSVHMNVHTNRFQCNNCQKCWPSTAALVRHLRSHTKEKPFQCKTCASCFRKKSSLVRHGNTAHQKNLY